MTRIAMPDTRTVRRWSHAAQTVPKVTITMVRHCVLPIGMTTARTLRDEGLGDLHWKVLGDAIVRFFQYAGPVFTKLGQILATRSDLLPEPVRKRLEKLYAEQPPMSARELRRALERAYGPDTPFAHFEPTPIGVGSVGQVHRARTIHGENVIVKLLRPGVEGEIERELDAARVLLALLPDLPIAGASPDVTRFLLTRTLEDLAEGFLREVDLENEARTLETFETRFRDHPHVRVPRCHRELSDRDILVMEELVGEPLSAFRERAKTDPTLAKRVADLALTEILRQVFEVGHYHADPHGGNLLLLEDGRLGLIDLGLTGEFSPSDRKYIARAVKAFLSRDADGLIRSLLNFATIPDDFDHESFTADVIAVVAGGKDTLIEQLKGNGVGLTPAETSSALESLVTELFATAYRHRIYVPPSATLLIKTLVTIEGVARSIHPELNLATTAFPVVLRSLTPSWVRWLFGRR